MPPWPHPVVCWPGSPHTASTWLTQRHQQSSIEQTQMPPWPHPGVCWPGHLTQPAPGKSKGCSTQAQTDVPAPGTHAQPSNNSKDIDELTKGN
eukprot:1147834-Pelagomonas_calceolata.AAC.2